MLIPLLARKIFPCMLNGMSELMDRADALATEHPIGEVLENIFFGFFKFLGHAAGWIWLAIGFVCFSSYKLLFVIGLAFKDGFKQTVAPPAPASAPVTATAQLMEDDRITDAYQTPFGVPYGPNVQASHQ